MGFDRSRVTEVFTKPADGPGRAGSGYRVSEALVLTAGHVVAGLPTGPEAAPERLDSAGRCEVRPLGDADWAAGSVVWRDEDADLALIGLRTGVAPIPAGSSEPRWGAVEGVEPVAVTAVGFPWAQERPDRVRDSEQLFGFIAPMTTVKAGLYAVTVLTASPTGRAGGSPWAGMSGAALFAGPFLVAVVIIDPPKFGADRVMAVPVAPLLGGTQLAELLGVTPGAVAGVGPRFRLAVTADTSVAVAPPYRAATPRLGREPARLLLPEFGIVPFADRDNDLAALQEWCLGGTGTAIRLVTGSGGAGKTRLAAEACVRMAAQGWQAGFADPKAPGGQAQLEFDRPTLLAVDDADLNVPLLADLLQTLQWRSGVPPVRLLLLARHTTTWWDTLNQRTSQLADELADPPLTLHDGDLSLASRADQHARALMAFAAYLPQAVSPAGLTPPELSDPAFASPLLVHMHALLTASGADVPTTGTAVRERILAAVLDHEQNRWAATFPPAVPTSGARAQQQAVTAVTLLAPPTESATMQTLAVITEFAPDAAAGARAAAATWLRQLYPGTDPPWVASLRPDLLAEELLATCPQLSDLVLAGYKYISGPGQLEQLLSELTRAEARPPVHEALDRLLTDQLPGLLTTAISAPTGQLPGLLELALARCPQPAAAATLADQLPERSTGLAALAATLTYQAVLYYQQQAQARPDVVSSDLAMWLNNMSLRLADLGRREDALAAIGQAVGRYRELARGRPEVFNPDLAMSLANMSNALAGLRRHKDALAAISEAVDLRRGLAKAHPEVFNPDLAASLNNLSGRLADLDRRDDALAAISEAVTLYRELAKAHPEVFNSDLAASLNNLSRRLADLDRRDDALAAISEAVTLCRELAEGRPDAFNPDLATSLNSLSKRLADLGRWENALAAASEAVTRYRELARARPDAFIPGLASSLLNSGTILKQLGRDKEAQAADHEALVLYRFLHAAFPHIFRSDI